MSWVSTSCTARKTKSPIDCQGSKILDDSCYRSKYATGVVERFLHRQQEQPATTTAELTAGGRWGGHENEVGDAEVIGTLDVLVFEVAV